MNHFFESIINLFFPPKCPFCGKVLDEVGICPVCEKDLPWIPEEQVAKTEKDLTCAAPLWYEGAVREPLFVRWPGKIEAGSLSHALTTSPDFYPTLLELCDLPLRPQQHCDGVSLAPVLLNPQAKFDRGPIFWHYPHYGNQGGTPGSALRCGKWKYIEFYEDHSVRLFDLEQDVSEKHNVADVYPDLVRQFHSLLHEWLEAVDAWYPEVNPNAEQDMA